MCQPCRLIFFSGFMHRQLAITSLCLYRQADDPNYVLYTDKLEDFATKVITQQWNSRYDDRLELLKLPQLSTRRKRQNLSLCYRIVTGQSIIPPSFFIHHPCSHLRHNHHLPLYRPRVRTTAYQSSFSVSVIPLWNSLHRDLVSSPSCNSSNLAYLLSAYKTFKSSSVLYLSCSPYHFCFVSFLINMLMFYL